VLTSISQLLWENSIPFVYVHAVGFIGWIRLQINEYTVIESHPDNVKEDLRLDSPFPELVDYMDNVAVSSREDAIKMPWLVLLFKAIQTYMKGNESRDQNNEMDTTECHPCHLTSKQKQGFKEHLRQCKFSCHFYIVVYDNY
jgi:hypothetical protein